MDSRTLLMPRRHVVSVVGALEGWCPADRLCPPRLCWKAGEILWLSWEICTAARLPFIALRWPLFPESPGHSPALPIKRRPCLVGVTLFPLWGSDCYEEQGPVSSARLGCCWLAEEVDEEARRVDLA